MTRTKAEPNNLLDRAKAIWASNSDELAEPESRARLAQVNGIVDFIVDQFTDTLGTWREYPEPESITGGSHKKQIVVAGKPDYDPAQMKVAISKTRNVLSGSGLSTDEGLRVIDSVVSRIENECTVVYQLVNGVPHRINGSRHVVPKSKKDVVSEPDTTMPMEVYFAIENLKGCRLDHVVNETKKELEGLDPVDKVVKVSTLLDEWWMGKAPIHQSALKQLLEDLQKEAGIRAALRTTDAPKGGKVVGKTKLTVDRAILLMYAIGGSRLKGLDKKKVAVALSSLTGYAVSEFINSFSTVLPDQSGTVKKAITHPGAYLNDVREVCKILRMMGLSDEAEKLDDRE